jgi:hypothetical protein
VVDDLGLGSSPFVVAIQTSFRLAPGTIESGDDPRHPRITDVKTKRSATLRHAPQNNRLVFLIKRET